MASTRSWKTSWRGCSRRLVRVLALRHAPSPPPSPTPDSHPLLEERTVRAEIVNRLGKIAAAFWPQAKVLDSPPPNPFPFSACPSLEASSFFVFR